MLKRKVYQELLKWKENTEGKAVHYRRETDWQDNSDQGIWKK